MKHAILNVVERYPSSVTTAPMSGELGTPLGGSVSNPDPSGVSSVYTSTDLVLSSGSDRLQVPVVENEPWNFQRQPTSRAHT